MYLGKIDDIEGRVGLYPATRGIRVGESVMASLDLSASVRVIVLTLFWLRKPILYPRLLRYFVCSLQRSLYVSLEEHIRGILRAWLNGKACLVCKR